MRTAVIIGRNYEKELAGHIHSWHETVDAARTAAKPLGGTTRSEEVVCAYPELYGSDPMFPSREICASYNY